MFETGNGEAVVRSNSGVTDQDHSSRFVGGRNIHRLHGDPAKPKGGNLAGLPEKILKAFNTWAFKRQQPDDPKRMLELISEAVNRNEPVPFVLYWGKGLRAEIADPDKQCLDFLANLTHRVRDVYAPGAQVQLLLTDTHAQLNGHEQHTIDPYYADIAAAAERRGFATRRLSDVNRSVNDAWNNEGDAPEHVLNSLRASARKWYRGGGSADDGAAAYYKLNMLEKHTVEISYPRSIFITFNGSEVRDLFPDSLPVFYMYSLKRGFSVKPWFIDADGTATRLPELHDAAPCH